MVPLVASVSGGKDSAALCLWLKEQGIAYRAVFLDTGWEAPETYDYLRGDLERAIGPIEWIKPPLGFAGLVVQKGMFPSRLIRFCTQNLKIWPFIGWCERTYPARCVVNAVGIRAAESAARAALPPFGPMRETLGMIWVWRPLLRWTEQDVIDCHHRHGLRPNPLYLRGATRVGCHPCIFASKEDLRLVADDPERVKQIAGLERLLGRGRTMFHTRRSGANDPITIAEAVEWSCTGFGGRQRLLIDDGPQRGCYRWGLCE